MRKARRRTHTVRWKMLPDSRPQASFSAGPAPACPPLSQSGPCTRSVGRGPPRRGLPCRATAENGSSPSKPCSERCDPHTRERVDARPNRRPSQGYFLRPRGPVADRQPHCHAAEVVRTTGAATVLNASKCRINGAVVGAGTAHIYRCLASTGSGRLPHARAMALCCALSATGASARAYRGFGGMHEQSLSRRTIPRATACCCIPWPKTACPAYERFLLRAAVHREGALGECFDVGVGACEEVLLLAAAYGCREPGLGDDGVDVGP